jgi:hypothetical protein
LYGAFLPVRAHPTLTSGVRKFLTLFWSCPELKPDRPRIGGVTGWMENRVCAREYLDQDGKCQLEGQVWEWVDCSR